MRWVKKIAHLMKAHDTSLEERLLDNEDNVSNHIARGYYLTVPGIRLATLTNIIWTLGNMATALLLLQQFRFSCSDIVCDGVIISLLYVSIGTISCVLDPYILI